MEAEADPATPVDDPPVGPMDGTGVPLDHSARAQADEYAARGLAARRRVPRSSHAEWTAPSTRPDPVALLAQQAASRDPSLIPIRHARMLISPFTYYRGAALPMAIDLATTPSSGILVQLCGDAHLANFGVFGSPERHLVFDVNDFDETLRGPWEWDVKRLVASLEVAGRDNGFSTRERRTICRGTVRSYREAMRGFAERSILEVWYAHLDLDDLLPRFRSLLDPKKTPSVWHTIEKARAHDNLQAFSKLTDARDGELRLIHDPPLIVPIEELGETLDPAPFLEALQGFARIYRRSLQPDQRTLLEHYSVVHIARKVVGVGSVGTQAWIALLASRDRLDPLLLQIKEAKPSVLDGLSVRSLFTNEGRRVAVGQRMMQAATDILLGWARFSLHGATRDYYVRQLRDWKGSADVGGMTPAGMGLFSEMCGWTLARAHARSGDRIAIAAYLGNGDVFDRAVTSFAEAYAEQNEQDFRAMQEAVRDGRLSMAELDRPDNRRSPLPARHGARDG